MTITRCPKTSPSGQCLLTAGMHGDKHSFPKPVKREPRRVNPARLYEWLGREVLAAREEGEENELAANLDLSAGPGYMADAYAEVRRHMRSIDSSLPFIPEIDED